MTPENHTSPLKTPENKAKELMSLLESLVNVLEQEILLLTEPRTLTLTPVVQEKQNLLAQYEACLQEISATPSFLMNLDDSIKSSLKTWNERFQTAALENEKRLSIATRSSQMIADRIKKESERSMGPKVQSYGRSGAYTSSSHTRSAPIAINQTL